MVLPHYQASIGLNLLCRLPPDQSSHHRHRQVLPVVTVSRVWILQWFANCDRITFLSHSNMAGAGVRVTVCARNDLFGGPIHSRSGGQIRSIRCSIHVHSIPIPSFLFIPFRSFLSIPVLSIPFGFIHSASTIHSSSIIPLFPRPLVPAIRVAVSPCPVGRCGHAARGRISGRGALVGRVSHRGWRCCSDHQCVLRWCSCLPPTVTVPSGLTVECRPSCSPLLRRCCTVGCR